jgi:hypothetical protein
MWSLNSATTIKASTFALFTALFILFYGGCNMALGQQHIIANKDNTRPEITTQITKPAFITNLSAQRGSGYNEIAWTAMREDDTRMYIVEYSLNGIDFQTAGEVLTHAGTYSYKHHMLDEEMFRDQAILYRIRMEQKNNRAFPFYSGSVFLDGDANSPVKVFPTVVTNNSVNINTAWPVEKVIVVSASGQQVFAKDINGQKDYIPLVLPNLNRGIYFMTFYGKGWQTSSKIVL